MADWKTGQIMPGVGGTNGPIAPLQAEIAELRKRVERLEVVTQLHMENDLNSAHLSEATRAARRERPSQSQPDEPPKYGPNAEGARRIPASQPGEPQGEGVETAEDFARHLISWWPEEQRHPLPTLIAAVRSYTAAVRADERRSVAIARAESS